MKCLTGISGSGDSNKEACEMKIVIMGFVKVALIVLLAIWYPSETSGRPVVTDSLAS